MAKKIVEVSMVPGVIGVSRQSGRKVWKDVTVTVKYDNGSTKIEFFDWKPKADRFVSDLYEGESDD